MVKCIRDYFSSTPGSINVNQNNNYSIVLPFNQVTDVEVLADCNTQNNHIKISVQENINELEKFIISEERDDGIILSDIDPDLNILIPFITPVDTMIIVRFVLLLINTHTFSRCSMLT